MSGDSKTVAVGGINDNNYIGGTWVYKAGGDGHYKQVSNKPLVGNETQGRSQQGMQTFL